MEIDQQGKTVTGERLHVWNDPSVGMLTAQIDVHADIVLFVLVGATNGETLQLFELLQRSRMENWDI